MVWQQQWRVDMYSTSASEPVLHGFSVIRLITDDRRGDSVPVGVVAWDSPRDWFASRYLAAAESAGGVTKTGRRLLEIAVGQVHRWADRQTVPYAREPLSPTSPRFWSAVSEVLTTAVRFDPPRAMEPMDDPDREVESLFEAVVQPKQSSKVRAQRIDGEISRALGALAERVPRRVEVAAFGQARETVRRGAVSEKGVLLVDGVNLAGTSARADADALVSRFMRIAAAYPSRPVRMIVGYCASPGGLNGEAHMRDWIRTKLTEEVFDLAREHREFERAASEAWRMIEDPVQPNLL